MLKIQGFRYNFNAMQRSHSAWKKLPVLQKMTKYLWWKSSAEALKKPERLVAQVMNIGDYSDVCALVHAIGDQGLREVLQQAEAGEFEVRSWHYWHYRLGLARCEEEVPPMPVRKFSI